MDVGYRATEYRAVCIDGITSFIHASHLFQGRAGGWTVRRFVPESNLLITISFNRFGSVRVDGLCWCVNLLGIHPGVGRAYESCCVWELNAVQVNALRRPSHSGTTM